MKRYIITLLFLFYAGFVYASAGGGIVSDGSLNSIVGQAGDYFNITGGTVKGSSLFHSFREFNVETGQTADFQGAVNIENIISRVSGNNNSWINGALKSSINGANIYLINPNGVIFGENASLDITGSFYVGTSDYLKLGEGGIFYADLGETSILTAAPVEAFGFLGNGAGSISFNGAELSLADDKRLFLIGNLSEGIANSSFEVPGGRIDLISIGSNGEVKITDDRININSDLLGDININNSTLNVDNAEDSDAVGKIFIRGRSFSMNKGELSANNLSYIDAVGISIDIEASDMNFANDSYIMASSFGAGKGGDVKLSAYENINFMKSGIFTSSADEGDAGVFEINAKNISFMDETSLQMESYAGGKGGSMILSAYNDINFINSNILMSAWETGDAGFFKASARNIFFISGMSIDSNSYGSGKGGSVILNAYDNLNFINSEILVAARDLGDAGAVDITAKDILFKDGGYINGMTYGKGDAGKITLTAEKSILFIGDENERTSVIGSGVSSDSIGGRGGDISLNAPYITLKNGAEISADTEYNGNIINGDEGRGGSIEICGVSLILENGSKINAGTKGTGYGGNIIIDESSNLLVAGGSSISSGSASLASDAGKAGGIEISTGNSVELKYAGTVSTASFNSGGGDIKIRTNKMLRLLDGKITTSTKSDNNNDRGGDIYIDPIFVILQNSSRIQANAFGGPGGNIEIITDYLIKSPDSIIEASSTKSVDGDVDIKMIDFDVATSLVNIETDFLDVSKLERKHCASRSKENASRLVFKGKDAVSTAFDDFMSSLPLIFSYSDFFHKDDNPDRRSYIEPDKYPDIFKEECAECGD